MPVVTKLSKFADNTLGTVYGDCAGDVVINEMFIDLTAAQVVNGNVFDLGILPAGHRVVDMTLIPDDLDTNGTPTITLGVGLLSGTPGDDVSNRTLGSEFFSGDIAARTGVISRMSAATGFRVQATEADRSIGVGITAAVATAAAGRIRLQVWMAPSDHRLAF